MSETSATDTDKTPTTATPSGAHQTPTGEKPAAEKPAPGAKVAPAADKPAAPATDKPAAAAKPAEPAEPVFNVDELISCTARFTHKAWHLFYTNRADMTFIRETPVRARLEARTAAGAEELHKLLTEAGVTEISRNDKVLSFTATFETIQKVIKLPQTYMLDAVRI